MPFFFKAHRKLDIVRVLKTVSVSAVALVLLAPGCAVSSYDGKDLDRAVGTYRTEFPAIAGTPAPLPANSPESELFERVLDRVMTDYVSKQDASVLVDRALEGAREVKATKPASGEHELSEAALHAMLRSLDPYSDFLDAEQFRYFREQTQGEFGGLGIEVAMDEGTGLVRIVSPIEGSPAAIAGLRGGDLITRIDNIPVKGMALADAVARMRGPIGSAVSLTIERKGVAPLVAHLIRAVVQIHSVVHQMQGADVGYIKITTFNQQTTTGLDDAIHDIEHAGGNHLAGVVLDLRNNLGGLLDQAVSVSSRFIGPRDVVTIRSRYQSETRTGMANASLNGVPMVLLVNANSASASEIVTGALQDTGRATVMGVRTFGKGAVQTLSPLDDVVGMRLTTARYYRPSGATVNCFGVTPDIEVRAAQGDAKETHADPKACDPQASPPPARVMTATMESACPATAAAHFGAGEDVALRCAVEYLHGRPRLPDPNFGKTH